MISLHFTKALPVENIDSASGAVSTGHAAIETLPLGRKDPSASAVSSVDNSSMSRNWKTIRKDGSSSPITFGENVAEFGLAVAIFRRGTPVFDLAGDHVFAGVDVLIEDTTFGRRRRSFIKAWFTAMRTSQV